MKSRRERYLLEPLLAAMAQVLPFLIGVGGGPRVQSRTLE